MVGSDLKRAAFLEEGADSEGLYLLSLGCFDGSISDHNSKTASHQLLINWLKVRVLPGPPSFYEGIEANGLTERKACLTLASHFLSSASPKKGSSARGVYRG